MPAGERHRTLGTWTCLVRADRPARHARLTAGGTPWTGAKKTPEDRLDSIFRYGVMAAPRARQLQTGSQPLIDSRSNKACRVAQEEIAAGKVKAAPRRAEGSREVVAEPEDPQDNHS